MPDAPADPAPLLSLVKIRDRYITLMQAYARSGGEPSPELLADITDFQAQVSAAGAGISGSDERFEAQSTINYWQTVRINAGERPPTLVLADFDREAARRQAGDTPPYKGLAPFLTSDNRFFSGRYDLVRRLVDKVKFHRLLALTGLSGSGKSSVVRAGLIPDLAEGAYDGIDDNGLTDSATWLYPQPILPGADPLGALEAVHGPIATPADLPAALDRQGAPVLLSIDQFEEVFTLSPEGERRTLFLDALVAAASQGEHRHVVVVTMRGEYDTLVEKHPAFAALFTAGREGIQTMSAADLRKAIEEPANRLGVGFDADLVDKLMSRVQGEPAGLPLLSFTLLKLWEMRGDGPMKTADYDALGGNPRDILANSADKVFENFLTQDQTLARGIFTGLVKIGDSLEATSMRITRAALDVLGARDNIDRVLGILVTEGLIRTSPTGAITPETQIEVAHEALIRNWSRLTGWVKESFAEQTNRKAFALRAERWKPEDKNSELLSGFALEEAKGFQQLTDKERLYIAASEARARRREIWRWSAIVALVVLVLLLLGAIFYIVRQNQAKEAAAKLSSLIALSDQLIDQGELVLAKKVMVLGLAAGAAPPVPMRAALQAAQLNELEYKPLTVPGAGAALGVSVAQDGSQLISVWVDGRARVWRRSPDRKGWLSTPIELAVPGRIITAVALSPDGKSAISASRDKMTAEASLERWTIPADLANPKPTYGVLEAYVPGEGDIVSVKFSPDGKRIVIANAARVDASEDAGNDAKDDPGFGYATVHDSRSGAQIGPEIGVGGSTTVAIFSPKGDKILVAEKYGSVSIYDSATFEPIVEGIWPDKGSITTARFTDTGARFAVGTKKGLILVYQAADGQKLFQLPGHAKGVSSLTFAPDSSMIASASPDGTVRLWEHGISSGRLLRTLTTGARGVTAVTFTPDGESLVLSTGSGTIQVVDFNGKKLRSESRLLPRDPKKLNAWLRLSHNNKVVVTQSQSLDADRTAAAFRSTLDIWDVATAKRMSALPTLQNVQNHFLSADGELFAVVHDIGEDIENPQTVLDVYSTRDGKRAARTTLASYSFEIAGDDAEYADYFLEIALAADGKALAAVTGGRRLLIWTGGNTLAAVPLAKNHPILTAGEAEAAPLLRFSGVEPKRFALALQGDRLAVVHDGVTGKEIARIRTPSPIETLDFTPDGTGLFIGTGIGTGAIWDAQTGKLRRLLRGRHENAITFHRFDKSGTVLLTASIDGTARLWDARTGDLRHVLTSPQGSIDGVFSDNGRYVVTGSESRIATVWDVATGKRLTALAGPLKSGGGVGWFTSNDTEVMTLAEDTTLRRWSIATPDMDYRGLLEAACADGRDSFTEDEIQRLGLEKGSRLPKCPPVAKRAAARSVSPPPN
jgi:WD40 repeat protein